MIHLLPRTPRPSKLTPLEPTRLEQVASFALYAAAGLAVGLIVAAGMLAAVLF